MNVKAMQEYQMHQARLREANFGAESPTFDISIQSDSEANKKRQQELMKLLGACLVSGFVGYYAHMLTTQRVRR